MKNYLIDDQSSLILLFFFFNHLFDWASEVPDLLDQHGILLATGTAGRLYCYGLNFVKPESFLKRVLNKRQITQ